MNIDGCVSHDDCSDGKCEGKHREEYEEERDELSSFMKMIVHAPDRKEKEENGSAREEFSHAHGMRPT